MYLLPTEVIVRANMLNSLVALSRKMNLSTVVVYGFKILGVKNDVMQYYNSAQANSIRLSSVAGGVAGQLSELADQSPLC